MAGLSLSQQAAAGAGDQEELEQYLHEVETLFEGWVVPSRESSTQPLRVSVDQVGILHRPLIYYAVSEEIFVPHYASPGLQGSIPETDN